MVRYRIVKKVIVGICYTVGVVSLSAFAFAYSKFNLMPYDWAWFLSDKAETIDVYHINWACDCADYYFQTTPPADRDTIPESDYFFVEPSDPSLKVRTRLDDSSCVYNYIRLTGRFYTDRGISRTYELKTPEKPKSAPVFRYDKIEYRLE